MSTTDTRAAFEAWAIKENYAFYSESERSVLFYGVSGTRNAIQKAWEAGMAQAATEAAKATGTAGEPDAFMVVQGGDEPVSVHFQRVNAKISANKFSASEIVPLYRAALAEIAAPVLSDEQILTIAKKELGHWNYEDDVVAFAQAILAATRSQP